MPLPEWFVPDTPLHEVHRLKGTGEITYLTHNFFATHELADAFHEKYPSSVREHRIWSPTHLASLMTTTHYAGPTPYVTGVSKHYFKKPLAEPTAHDKMEAIAFRNNLLAAYP